MKTTRIWANYAVADLERTTRFYTLLGFEPNGSSAELTSFKVGEHAFVIHFFLKEVLEKNTRVTIAEKHAGNEIVFTLSAESRAEADHWAEKVLVGGGTLVSRPAAFGPGYYGFVFSDPDGHKFNVLCM